MGKREIWVAGYPSFVGGADSELDHNIDLWLMNGVEVHLVPMPACSPEMKILCDQRGCITHDYHPAIFRDKIVVSFCNGHFLDTMQEIYENGKPAAVLWFNCMTWTFEKELVAVNNGWITLHGFVSKFQRSILKPALEKIAPIQEFEGYRPYFNPDNISQNFEFRYNKPDKWFALGRVSRDDYTKFSDDMWNIYYKVCSPLRKKIFILGFGANARKRCGNSPASLDVQVWDPGVVAVKEVYKLLHCMIHKTGGSKESYCRVVPEAFVSGVPVIVEDDFAFPDLIQNGETGYLCKSSDEMSFRASELAFDEEKRKKIIHSAYDVLVNEIASKDACWNAWDKVLSSFGR